MTSYDTATFKSEGIAKSFRLIDAMEEVDRQIDRMGSLTGNFEDALHSVSIPGTSDDNAVPAPLGDSAHAQAVYAFANRIRVHNNRLETLLRSLDL